MQHLRKILGQFVKDFGIEGGAALSVIKRQWKDIAGPAVAAHTFPDIIKGGILTIIVDTPQWMHHLSFFKGDISEKLRTFNVNVQDVRFRLGRLPEKTWSYAGTENVKLTADDARFIENTLRHVKDEDLRKTFEKLIAHGLTKGKRRGKV
jgi:hypothetical protein